MSTKIVLDVQVVERKDNGVEIRAVKLSPEARRALSTSGAEIMLPVEASEAVASKLR